ncbi:hypothetical protein LTR97_003191 [Elasticomyces elasticus]|uniref:Uncharacterized protein n=1 Tax=Elasticomyces elasticus TaxID=574655 RepID=A0AAN7VVF0_9PEZI|nr:hypothetical protein LTR97_003191 [Elasticomyces elasticus]
MTSNHTDFLNYATKNHPIAAMELPKTTSSEALATHIKAAPLFKDDLDAFHQPINEGKGFITAMPPELLDNILSYCVLDHEPEIAARAQREGKSYTRQSHVLVSLAAMSRMFRDCVESFCLRELRSNKQHTQFKTTDEMRRISQLNKPTRRSTRLAGKSEQDHRVYRMEYVRILRSYCIKCSQCLTDALKDYDLRDYMLVSTRPHGPRAQHTNLPRIPYGTTRCGTYIALGTCISYRFYLRDVKRIAELVHPDLDAHLAKRNDARVARKCRKALPHLVEMQIKQLKTSAAQYKRSSRREPFLERIKYYKAMDVDKVDHVQAVKEISPSDLNEYTGKDHKKVCIELDCEYCEDEMQMRSKVWHRQELRRSRGSRTGYWLRSA